MKRAIPIFNFTIQNASKNEVDIHIDGDIVDSPTQELLRNWYGDETSISFKSFRETVTSADAKVYNIYINSGGGSLIEALAMHDLIIELQGKGKTVNTIGRGIIASAATFILMAGKSPEMTANSWLMIHNVSGVIWGDVNEIENYAASLRQFNDKARDFYSNHTGARKEDVTKMMNSETWMPAEEAKEKGFIASISGEANFSNKISSDHWQFSDNSILNAYNSSVGKSPSSDNSVTTLLKNISNDMKVSFKSITDALKSTKPANADASTIVTALTESLSPAFDAVAAQIETDANLEIINSVKKITDDLTSSLTTSLTASITDSVTKSVTASFEKRIKDLEDNNAGLEKEIQNGLGGESRSKNEDEPKPKMKATFSKAVGVLG